MKRRFTALGLAIAALVAASLQLGINPANSQSPTPTTAPGTGSISGRVFVDVDANGSFGGPDVPLEFPLELISWDANVFDGTKSEPDGTYLFGDLPPGNYELRISVPVFSCAIDIRPFTWVGDTFFPHTCPFIQLSTPFRTYSLANGENAIDIDFPETPISYDVTARIWLNASPLTGNNRVAVTAGGRECWAAQTNGTLTSAEIPVTFYAAALLPSVDPACQGGELDITIGGQPAGATTEWNRFWRASLSLGPRPLNLTSDAFLTSTDVTAPPFLGVSGQVVDAGTVTAENVAQRQGTLVPDGAAVTAYIGNTPCGETRTKALRGAPSGANPAGEFGGNLFGLVVPPASVQPGCGTPGAPVTFCIGDFKARQPAAGPFSHYQSPEAKPVRWAAPEPADITIEPTTEPCLGVAPTATPAPGPGPDRLPTSLPATGGRPGR